MYLCFILIPVIGLLIYLYFLCIKIGLTDEKKSSWLLALGVIVGLVVYAVYCPYPKIVIPLIILVSLIAYVSIVLKA